MSASVTSRLRDLSMSISSVEFPLSPVKGRSGIVPEPIIPIQICTGGVGRFYDFLVDSGADTTLLPKSLASELGINIKSCPRSITQGVEGGGIRIYHASVILRLGAWQDRVRCAFAEHDQIPPLLGRLDIFSRYTITFHAERHSIIFRRRK